MGTERSEPQRTETESRETSSAELSPYRRFTRTQWASLRGDTPLTLSESDLKALQSIESPVSSEEVVQVYLPLSRLLSLYVAATQGLFRATQEFLGVAVERTPFIIGIAGSVAVGKSSTARVLKALLARWPNTPKVDLVTTDGFLFPNAILTKKGLMERKGFPESYDVAALTSFLARIKAGEAKVTAPVYSHLTYDIVPNKNLSVDRPDILIVEGLNVLLPGAAGIETPFVSDFFDFSIYLHANEKDLEAWYIKRFMALRRTAFRDAQSYFGKYVDLSDEDAVKTAKSIWARINLRNLRDNVLPTKSRASLILTKGASHAIEEIALRKI